MGLLQLGHSIFTRLMAAIILLTLLSGGINLYLSVNRLKDRTEAETCYQARLIASQFLGIRAFIAQHNEPVPYQNNNNLEQPTEFKHLSPEAAEEGVRALFDDEIVWRFKEIWLPDGDISHVQQSIEKQLLDELQANPNQQSAFDTDNYNGISTFFYLVPISINESCLGCHGKEVAGNYRAPAYDEGDLAGAVSISIPMTVFQERIMTDIKAHAVINLLLIFLLIISLYYLMRVTIHKPLQYLVWMSQEIGEGKLKKSWSEEKLPEEFGVLYQAFKKMAEKLRKFYEGLESQVIARTEQLRKANKQLRDQEQNLVAVNRQLAKANKIQSEFLASVSHELRTPLTSIMAFTEMMQEGLAGNVTKEQTEYLSDIQRSSKELLDNINDILDMARIEARKMELTLENVSPKTLCKTVVRCLEPLALKKDITLVTEIPDIDLPNVLADRAKLGHVLTNLVDNAIKFSDHGQKIVISVNEEEEGIIFSVKDSGPGIPQIELKTIFEPFRQVGNSSTRRHRGSGLGLALAKSLISLHNGTIWVESKVGAGSTFHVLIPLEQH